MTAGFLVMNYNHVGPLVEGVQISKRVSSSYGRVWGSGLMFTSLLVLLD